MSANWVTVKLGIVVESCLGKMLDQNKNKGEFYPYLGNSNVRWGSFDLSNLAKMKFEETEFLRYGLKDGDLLVCEGGEPGRCAIWKNNIPNMKFQKALHRIRPKNQLNNYYLYYWFKLSHQLGKLEPFFTGTTIKHLTGKALSELNIQLPPLDYQWKVANILKSLDDKIELNRQTNQTLEQIAQAMFKNWFVDFEPTRAKIAAIEAGATAKEVERAAMCSISGKTDEELDQLAPEVLQQLKVTAALFPDALVESELGEVPEGWKLSEIGNEVDIVGGGTPSTTNSEFWEDGDHHWTTPKDMSNLTDKILLQTERKVTDSGLKKISSGLLPINTVLMSSRAPVGYLAITKIPVAINQGYIAMKCNDVLTPEYVVQWAQSVIDEIQQRASGTTFAEISKRNFRVIKVLVPKDALVQSYSRVVGNLYEKISSALKETIALAELRDSLLPKLLSGEIKVSNVN
ncbi:restriction endonuclease subunit S [Undibacterium sp. JH2W]|uniref:restriction endonuclease subunit S n=1 Tax=Undibacterium sp. JH2W TaxID=3413037 RepID=UPI003BF1ACD8